jgi:hypothetical protein
MSRVWRLTRRKAGGKCRSRTKMLRFLRGTWLNDQGLPGLLELQPQLWTTRKMCDSVPTHAGSHQPVFQRPLREILFKILQRPDLPTSVSGNPDCASVKSTQPTADFWVVGEQKACALSTAALLGDHDLELPHYALFESGHAERAYRREHCILWSGSKESVRYTSG